MQVTGRRRGLGLAGALGLLAGCMPGDGGDPGPPPLPGPPVVVYPAAVDADGVRLPGSLLARGDSVFHGRGVGPVCSACHGREGVGTPMVSSLIDNHWSYTDGSLEGIREVTRTGIEDAPSPMPPMGGATLSEADLDAVAAYVYWISRREG
jgi:mono/diheme cytochrome c family protein